MLECRHEHANHPGKVDIQVGGEATDVHAVSGVGEDQTAVFEFRVLFACVAKDAPGVAVMTGLHCRHPVNDLTLRPWPKERRGGAQDDFAGEHLGRKHDGEPRCDMRARSLPQRPKPSALDLDFFSLRTQSRVTQRLW